MNIDNTLHEWVEQERTEQIGADRERQAIVLFLRASAKSRATGSEIRLLQDQATRIERGEHSCEETK